MPKIVSSSSKAGATSATAVKDGMSKGKRKALDITGFRSVQEGRSYLIEVPHTFKVPAMLDFLRTNLPMTNPAAVFSN